MLTLFRPKKNHSQQRNIGLDVLRAIAVLLVIFRHSDIGHWPVFRFGWLGVDLFFVLSGFLISNLLFSEYKTTGAADIGRFLFRRAFKIFPPFYFFVAITLLVQYLTAGRFDFGWKNLIAELVYLQSYFYGIWNHTWTLAVEEHFYFSFAVLMLLLVKRNWLEKKQLIIATLLLLLVASLLLRLRLSYLHKNEAFFSFTETHLRADGILVGVLLSYLLNFAGYARQLLRHKLPVLCVAVALAAPGLYLQGGQFFMNTFGLSLVNVGFGLLVLLALQLPNVLEQKPYLKLPLALLAFVGVNSYSVYLWHLNAQQLAETYFAGSPLVSRLLLYVLTALLLGIAMAYLVEKPSLWLRKKIFEKPVIRKVI
jgi:peptidoglycan/LPS O-acetylase OafA/YrhL